MTLGERIRKTRTSSRPKLSQEAFADSIGKTRPAIAAYELDKVVPDDSVILLISKTYGVRYEWLKNDEEPMYPPEADDLLVRVTRIMEGQSPSKLKAIEMIIDMPDELLDWVYEYYKDKQKKE